MRTLIDQLSQYAAYHRDVRNILTHMVGIPLIVVAVATLLSHPVVRVASWPVSPALLVSVAAALFYLRLDPRFGVVMALLLGGAVWVGRVLVAQPADLWLSSGLGMFFVGWVIQFIGHYYEGRKPAFVDDLVGLLVGPLFIVAEVAFFLGLREEVRRAVEERAGPLRGGAGKAPV